MWQVATGFDLWATWFDLWSTWFGILLAKTDHLVHVIGHLDQIWDQLLNLCIWEVTTGPQLLLKAQDLVTISAISEIAFNVGHLKLAFTGPGGPLTFKT